MITIEKLNEYEEYHGYYDGFYIQKVKNNTNINSDNDWYLIRNLIQDFNLIKKGLASKKFTESFNIKLHKHFESEATIEQFKKIAEQEW